MLSHLTVPLISVSGRVFFAFPELGHLSKALRWSAGFGLCSYFAVRLLVLKATSKCAKVQFYFLFISCFLIGKWEQLCPGNKSRLFAYRVVIGLCIDGLAKSRCISVVIGYAN